MHYVFMALLSWELLCCRVMISSESLLSRECYISDLLFIENFFHPFSYKTFSICIPIGIYMLLGRHVKSYVDVHIGTITRSYAFGTF